MKWRQGRCRAADDRSPTRCISSHPVPDNVITTIMYYLQYNTNSMRAAYNTQLSACAHAVAVNMHKLTTEYTHSQILQQVF